MTLDERLERLTERHEALTQSVELIVAENRQAAENLAAMAAENKQLAAENKQRDRRLGEIMEGIASLLHVAEIHEQRLDRHDDRLDNLH
jgi:regulator of replication initiation timing